MTSLLEPQAEKIGRNWFGLNRFKKNKEKDVKPGLGTFVGVFVPCILMVFGVIIFLRLGWIVGQAGLPMTLAIITLASFIAFITTLSMASISTNISVGKGGVYYILSRSLGIEVGAAIGIPLYLKQALSIAFCVIGFAESLHDLVPIWSITTIGISTLIVLTLLAYFSLSGALKVQVGIFVILIASLISLFMGGSEFIPPQPDLFVPEIPRSLGFWAIFAIFFPAMTGVESSVSLSGDLRNPAKSLPLGTISALLVAYAIYMVIPMFLVSHVSLDVLASDPLIMQSIAKVPSLIILGIWGATISSALGGLLGAPRTLQALADDGVVPKIFGKTFGKALEPRLATLITCLLSLCGIYFGSVNIIAPVLTMICLICYGVLNFSAGFETLMANPSWRPRFCIHWSISMIGALSCFLAMMMIGAGSAIIAIGLVMIIFLVVKRRQLTSGWDDVRHGILLFMTRFAIYRITHAESLSKSWRPHFLVFSSKSEGYLLQFSQSISQSKGFLTMASFLPPEAQNEMEKKALRLNMESQLNKQHIQALVHIGYSEKITTGMNHMIENYGLGPLTPNTIVCGGGFAEEDAEGFSGVIHKAYQRHCNMVVLNENQGLTVHSTGDIHVWWDATCKDNSELMLVFAYMLTRNPRWKKSKICLKAIVASEILREKTKMEFQELSINKRLSLEIDILISGDREKEFPLLVSEFSKDAGILFISLSPPKQDTPTEAYTEYLKSLSQFSKDLPSVAFVLSSEHTPLENILA